MFFYIIYYYYIIFILDRAQPRRAWLGLLVAQQTWPSHLGWADMGTTHALHGHWPGLVTILIIINFCLQNKLVLYAAMGFCCREEKEKLLDTWWKSQWWECWWLKLTVERKGREKSSVVSINRGKGWFPPPSSHEIHRYLYGVEEGHFVLNGAKSWPLIRPRKIPTVGLKWLS